jgi:predicted nucleotidyltransferase
VFGTFASGQPFEDLDLGLVLDGAAELDPRFLSRLAGALERATGRPRLEVDLVDLRATPPRFQHAVTSQGRLLCCRDRQARLEYEARLMSEYLDYKPVDEFFDRVALERARGGGVG